MTFLWRSAPLFAQSNQISPVAATSPFAPPTARFEAANPIDGAAVPANTPASSLEIKDVNLRLTNIDNAILDLKHSTLWTTLNPAIIAALSGLLGVLIGGIINNRMQRSRLSQEAAIANDAAERERSLAEAQGVRERDLAQKQAKLQIGSAVVEWELKQLHLLYGPVRALLGQSFGLYRQMNKVLEQTDKKRFRFVKSSQPSGHTSEDGDEFQIFTPSQQWERFRTVMHIDLVYGKGYGVETYFDEIVSIGGRVVEIIEQNAGYARPEEAELMNVFAKYLAHFAVLKHLHDNAKRALYAAHQEVQSGDVATPDESLKVDLSAVFPVELHTLIAAGFDAIARDIGHWRTNALA